MPIEGKKDSVKSDQILCLVFLFLVIALVALAVVAAIIHPELLKEMTQEQRTARLVVERMRDELGMKVQLQDTEGHIRQVPTSPNITQTNSIEDDRLVDIKLRLERLELLMLQLPEKITANKSAPTKTAKTNDGNQLEQMNRRLELPPLLSQSPKEVNRAERTMVTFTGDMSAAETEGAAKFAAAVLLLLILGVVLLGLGYLDAKDKPNREAKAKAEEEDKQRRVAEVVVERLAVELRDGSLTLGIEKKPGSTENAAAVKGLKLTANKTAQ